MVFGEWFCVVCQKTLNVGTVAPRSAMHRHLDSARHKKLAAEQQAAKDIVQAISDVTRSPLPPTGAQA
jgi:hypothetical protein